MSPAAVSIRRGLPPCCAVTCWWPTPRRGTSRVGHPNPGAGRVHGVDPAWTVNRHGRFYDDVLAVDQKVRASVAEIPPPLEDPEVPIPKHWVATSRGPGGRSTVRWHSPSITPPASPQIRGPRSTGQDDLLSKLGLRRRGSDMATLVLMPNHGGTSVDRSRPRPRRGRFCRLR